MAKTNPFRFSNKYQDDETDLLYYGYRYYSASMGRWLSRDPAEEAGGCNLYGFVANDAISDADYLGLSSGYFQLKAGGKWSPNFSWPWNIGGFNGLSDLIIALHDDCNISVTHHDVLKTRRGWSVASDKSNGSVYDSNRKCRCGFGKCYKFTRTVTWTSGMKIPIPKIPWPFPSLKLTATQTVTIEFNVCSDGVSNSATSTGSQSGRNLSWWYHLEDF